MKKPQTTLVRATRILGKTNAFENRNDISSKNSYYIGSILDDNNNYVDIFDNYIIINREKLNIIDIHNVSIIEDNADCAKTIRIKANNNFYDLVISSKTDRFHDIFEIVRFFIRIIEDNKLT